MQGISSTCAKTPNILVATADESGQNGIYVRPFPNVNDRKWKVSRSYGAVQKWSPDGQELFYWNDDAIMAVKVETSPTFKAGTPKVLFQRTPVLSSNMGGRGIAWDISPDGKRFLMMKPPETLDEEITEIIEANPRKIIIVNNWFEELKQKVPAE